MNQALDPRLQLHEGAVVGDIGDAARKLGVDRVLSLDALPRIVKQLLHAERDTVRLVVDLDDLDLDGLSDRQNLGRMIHATPCDIGHMQQSVDAAEIHERTVIGDVLDRPVDDLALFEVGHDLMTLLGAGLFENRAARNDDVAAAAVHLEDLKRLRHAHEGRHVAHRADIDLRARQERHGAVEVDREAALDLVEDDAFDLFLLLECFFELDPALFATGLVAGNDGFAERILDALQVHLDNIADVRRSLATLAREFLERHATLGLQTDIDNRHILFDSDDGPADDGSFKGIVLAVALIEHCGEIFTRGRAFGVNCGHLFSWSARSGSAGGWC